MGDNESGDNESGDNESDEDARETQQPRQQDSAERRNWFRRHSGTILTTLLFPIVSGLIVLAVEKFTDDDDAAASTSAQQTTRGDSPDDRSPASTSSAAPPTSATASPSDVRWSGTINLTYLDLDSVPPRVLSSNSGASTWVSYDRTSSGGFSAATLYGLGGGFFTTKPTIALWTTSDRPTRQQCSDLVATQGAETLPLATDSAYCVKTAAGRTAFITGLSVSNAVHAYTASVTVWSATQ